MEMLNEFCRQHEIDILLLQEVTHEEFEACSGYTAHVNIGKDQRGTAILMLHPPLLEMIQCPRDGIKHGIIRTRIL
jgi:exonuclease III